ncbi:ArsR/SmtB family transcription factor [Aurantimonas endophytica]|uniref:DNA-binding transcriptional ArsR family regulator n=1 Tax=Aurantimonas endophytica TaxID=1522175 RepID=A0A7W6HF29_9HYPH|nr:metalloregulator ArsR/SmtB family transcription factor [Aurantimonas endophytica]MBB4004056.1 DNA-binding transcriptional ArsR family regulator [Aurantimonas endophytica]MCO6404902.1 metalloregulator ArsR/SmtB family transcription factor [Aurantimonas endophytica]
MIDPPTGGSIAANAFLMGDPARANMLSALMGGEALTAGELAAHAGVTPQTASGHLARLRDGGLLAVERQGRHRYFRLASPQVAEALEGLMALSGKGPVPRVRGPRDAAMRLARSCYDHLAGRLGVAIADALQRQGFIQLDDGVVSDDGRRFLSDFGIDLGALHAGKRPLCRTCLDWSERRAHLAGRLGAALLDRSIALGWLLRVPASRTLRISQAGERGFAGTFRCEPVWIAPAPAEARRESIILTASQTRRSTDRTSRRA